MKKELKTNMLKLRSVLAIALVAVIGFSMAACDNDDRIADPHNGKWISDDGEIITLTNGSFVISRNNKLGARGIYTVDAYGIITLTVQALHGDILNEITENGILITFEKKWYTQNQVKDAFRKRMKEEYPLYTDNLISIYLAELFDYLDTEIFTTTTGSIYNGILTWDDDGRTFTKDTGGSENPNPNPIPIGNMKWTAVSNSPFDGRDNNWINAITWGNNMFVVVDQAGEIGTSPDGVTWTNIGNNPFKANNNMIKGVAYGNNKFVAVGGYGGSMIATSTNGTTWTVVNDHPFTDTIETITFANNIFIAAGWGEMATSTNGTTWTNVDIKSALGFSPVESIAYGNGTFVAAASINSKMAYSTDNGVNWTFKDLSSLVDIDGNGDGFNAIAYGNGRFVAGSYQGKLVTSTNGRDWTLVSNNTFGNTDNQIYTIAYGNGKFVAGAYSGKTAYSTNGTTWTPITTTAFDYTYLSYTLQYHVEAIAYGNGRFVAGCWKGKMAYMRD
jgi:hypothetical protein